MRLIDADDLIKKLDEQIQMPTFMDCLSAINIAPTIEPKTKIIAQVTFDEEKLREIVKEAVERFKEEYEIVDRPQGHWTKTDVATYRCSECGKLQIADDVNELNFCCCCGSRNKMRRLKGADDEVQ
jgi:ABC-type ATPase with predicted acetyltransferase domain